MDAEDVFDEQEEYQWVEMRRNGVSEADIKKLRANKQWKEDVYLYAQMIKQRAWKFDRSCDFADCYLRMCSALEGLTRRHEAISKLQEAHALRPNDHRIALALAKLLFKNDQKEESLDLCGLIFQLYADQSLGTSDTDNSSDESIPLITEDEASDAYYLGGWVKIHDDDHSNAYRIWKAGHIAVPSSELLATQHKKRTVWDVEWSAPSDQISHLIGSSCNYTSSDNMDSSGGFDAFPCYNPSGSTKSVRFLLEGEVQRTFLTPALGLFDADQERRGLVFRTRKPVLTAQECSNVVEIVNRHHEEVCNGVWGTVRHSSVKTTDVAVESIPILQDWLLTLMHTRLNLILAHLYPKLADGSMLCDLETPQKSRVRIHDAFIVRYDAEKDLSLSLPEHCDTSAVSVVVSLNSEQEGHYTGGGTWFEALGEHGLVVDAEVGHAVLFAGPLKHAGYPTTQGTRMILVLFLYVEDFHYGPYLTNAKAHCRAAQCSTEETFATAVTTAVGEEKAQSCDPAVTCKTEAGCREDGKLHSGGEKGGFVVYRQTVDLVNMLEKSIVVSDE